MFHLIEWQKTTQNTNDMAKVTIKTEKTTTFGRVFCDIEQFDDLQPKAKHSTFCPRCKLFNSLTKNKSPKNKRKSQKNTYLCGIIKTTNQNVYT